MICFLSSHFYIFAHISCNNQHKDYLFFHHKFDTPKSIHFHKLNSTHLFPLPGKNTYIGCIFCIFSYYTKIIFYFFVSSQYQCHEQYPIFSLIFNFLKHLATVLINICRLARQLITQLANRLFLLWNFF